jgi:hypothetical protein
VSRAGSETSSLNARFFSANFCTVELETIEQILVPFWRTDDGLTATERAVKYGIDLSLLTENLRLTPEQRIDQNQAALEFVIELQRAYC